MILSMRSVPGTEAHSQAHCPVYYPLISTLPTSLWTIAPRHMIPTATLATVNTFVTLFPVFIVSSPIVRFSVLLPCEKSSPPTRANRQRCSSSVHRHRPPFGLGVDTRCEIRDAGFGAWAGAKQIVIRSRRRSRPPVFPSVDDDGRRLRITRGEPESTKLATKFEDSFTAWLRKGSQLTQLALPVLPAVSSRAFAILMLNTVLLKLFMQFTVDVQEEVTRAAIK